MNGYGNMVTAFSGLAVLSPVDIPDAELAVDGSDYRGPIQHGYNPLTGGFNNQFKQTAPTDYESVMFSSNKQYTAADMNNGEFWLGDY